MQPDCKNRAPYLFIKTTEKAKIIRGNCNDWLCPRCGDIRARTEYHRMLTGVKNLIDDGHKLYFITLTCRGAELSISDAEQHYYEWTTKLLNACRNRHTRANLFWSYVQVTERQKRQHPHSHIITTYLPHDCVEIAENSPQGQKTAILQSDWFYKQCIKSGLGWQYKITEVRDGVGVANYLAKYLFKEAMKTQWPKNWRRVRYSRNWYKIPEQEYELSFPLLTRDDWRKLSVMPWIIETNDLVIYTDGKDNGLKNLHLT